MSTRQFTLAECKIQASILLKNMRSGLDENVITTLQQLSAFANLDNNSIIKQVQLKHTLQLIANQYGFESWRNLKAYFEKTGLTIFPMNSGFLNQWFANYKEAKLYLHTQPHDFLLPYKNHFVVCSANCIEHMGFNLQDQNWELIHNNWVEPINYQAWETLNIQYCKLKGQQNA